MLKKKNTFIDFIACAEHLIAERFTRPEKLFAMGGSAGGLLMGAVVNMRPDLFKGIIDSWRSLLCVQNKKGCFVLKSASR